MVSTWRQSLKSRRKVPDKNPTEPTKNRKNCEVYTLRKFLRKLQTLGKWSFQPLSQAFAFAFDEDELEDEEEQFLYRHLVLGFTQELILYQAYHVYGNDPLLWPGECYIVVKRAPLLINSTLEFFQITKNLDSIITRVKLFWALKSDSGDHNHSYSR